MRRELDIITHGNFKLLHRDDKEVFAYEREFEKEKLTVYCNFSDNERHFAQPDGELLIHNYECLQNTDEWVLRPYETAVFHRKF